MATHTASRGGAAVVRIHGFTAISKSRPSHVPDSVQKKVNRTGVHLALGLSGTATSTKWRPNCVLALSRSPIVSQLSDDQCKRKFAKAVILNLWPCFAVLA